MNFELRPNLNTVQLTKTVHPEPVEGWVIEAVHASTSLS